MEKLTASLETIGEKIRSNLSAKHAARERGLQLSRDTIRHCANAIRATHRGEYDLARGLLATARTLLEEAVTAVSGHNDILHAGFVHNAQKEYAEASVTLALVTGSNLPDPDELSISYKAYLNGLGEAVGELRRYLLDAIRRGEVSRCEQLLRAMDDIYSLLITIDFPDALTGGLRRTTDVMRSVLERTRGDLTMSLRQENLGKRLAALEERIDSGSL